MICDADYHPNRFDWTNIIMVIVESVAILILARQGKIISFKVIFRTSPPS